MAYMVGLVIVSHSRALANALLALIKQVTTEPIPVAVAAGVGDDRSEFGTDAIEIMDAIQSVFSPDGVMVMMDLGSAVLSSQMALDLLPPEIAEKVRFCGAPLVEGSIAASVRIGLGSDLETVYNEAIQALMPKNEQLGISTEPLPAAPATPVEEAGGMKTAQRVTLTLKNLHGLHARPAARFIKAASAFKSTIQVLNQTTGKGPVSAKSLNALATLGAVKDHQIVISADGADAAQALAELSVMVEDGFGELRAEASGAALQPKPVPSVQTASQKRTLSANEMTGVPVSEGIALGPLYHYALAAPTVPQGKIEDVEAELKRLDNAINQVGREIQQRRSKLAASVGEEQAAIFEAHLLILQDPDIQDQVHDLIKKQKENAAAAWSVIMHQVADTYRNLADDYMQQRSVDVLDVCNQVLYVLAGKGETAVVRFEQPVILFAEDITPTETSQLDMEQVLAIVTVGGGPTSHAAILARALGIPAISGADPALGGLQPGTALAIDGFDGSIWINPEESLRTELSAKRKDWLERRQKLLLSSHEVAQLKDGRRVEVAANIGNVADARAAVKNGAEGVGLLRTEFLFLTRQTPPSEEEQYEALRQIGEVLGDRPVVIRTLDVGGDKELPYINMPPEENPFLGVRAIRLSLQRPDLFMTQLRAILRAGANYPFRIMFPMVANLDEVLQARQWVVKAHEELQTEKIAHRWPIETGIMVEIPSAAVLSPVLAPHVDFFSIGTNDLTQYTLAAERGNPVLAGLADALHPAVLQLIQKVVAAAHGCGKWVGVCGELAGDPVAAPVLVGIGVDELSMNPGGIPRVKDLLRKMDLQTVEKLSASVLAAESAPAARKLAKEQLQSLGLL
jgi:multiphosphoryl transfer protein